MNRPAPPTKDVPTPAAPPPAPTTYIVPDVTPAGTVADVDPDENVTTIPGFEGPEPPPPPPPMFVSSVILFRLNVGVHNMQTV